MNAASRALHQVTLSIDFIKKVPPLDAYEGLSSPPQLMYEDQIAWITNYAIYHTCPPHVLFEAKSTTWQQMLFSLEAVNRVRHPSVREEYIKWRSQDMLVRRLWPDAKFLGIDPDVAYTQTRRKYCTAAKKLAGDMDEQGLDYMNALVQLKKTFNKKLFIARKVKVNTGGILERLCGIKTKQNKAAAQEIEGDDEFVIVEKYEENERYWEGDDWPMI